MGRRVSFWVWPGTGKRFGGGISQKRLRSLCWNDVGIWLKSLQINAVLIVGFYTHACVSTTAREALMMDFEVSIDYNGTGACDMSRELLGSLTADEVRNSALLQLSNMGAEIIIDNNEMNSSDQKEVNLTTA